MIFGVGISDDGAQAVITENLCYQHLTDEQRRQCLRVCQWLLSFYWDEMYRKYYTTDSKLWSRERQRRLHLSRPKLSTQHAKSSWTFSEVHERRAISTWYYCRLLDFLIQDVFHDNARFHADLQTCKNLENLFWFVNLLWTVIEEPFFSPDLSPCDYYMFGPLKGKLGGHRFDKDTAVGTFVRNWLKTRPPFFSITEWKTLLRWENMS